MSCQAPKRYCMPRSTPSRLKPAFSSACCSAMLLTSVEAFRDTAGRYEEVGVTDLVVHWPRPAPPFAGDEATFERTFERIFSG